jgi:hypothetical protein
MRLIPWTLRGGSEHHWCREMLSSISSLAQAFVHSMDVVLKDAFKAKGTVIRLPLHYLIF